jgi:hypothetical protein
VRSACVQYVDLQVLAWVHTIAVGHPA